ncbi:DtxR family iron (metal) dependent repressor [Kushneria indalinina DSM 14324]|nr:DtxR family iron (metal) dependent repressor [Kushneria indalinina DSM 14324]
MATLTGAVEYGVVYNPYYNSQLLCVTFIPVSAIDQERVMPSTSHHEHFERVRQDHQRELVEDYVEEIAHLHRHLGEARASDLADRFGVSPAAVSKVVTRLKRDGLVNARPYRGIFLTDQGEELAHKVAARHRVVLQALLALGVPESIARADSEGIEHHCSDETVAAMHRFLADNPHLVPDSISRMTSR